jgi:type I restriction enzyme S subunit
MKKLEEIIHIKHGFAFKGDFFVDDVTKNILVTPGNFNIGGGFKSDKIKYYDGPIPKDYVLNKGDVIVTMTDLSKQADTLGFSAKVPSNKNTIFLHNQRIGLVTIKDDGYDINYIYWILRTQDYQKFVAGSATGATVKHTSPSKIGFYSFNPHNDINIQRHIASILSAYDDLIENNLKRIKLLEEIAQRTYEEWFLKFRVNGEELPMDKTTGLPVGWKIVKLSDVSTRIQSGGTPSRSINSYWENGTMNWFKTKELQDSWLIDSEEKISIDALNNSSAKTFPPNTILMAIYASPTLGRLGLLQKESSCNQAAIGFICKENIVTFQWLYFKLFELRDRFNGIARGAGQQNISGELVKDQTIVLPKYETIKEFTDFVSPIMFQQLNLQKQNQKLKESRDILLPRLMNGTINVE